MKIILCFCVLALLMGPLGCESDGGGNENVTFTGTVVWKPLESGFFAIDADDGRKFEPINLPREFAVNGLRVRVTARVRDDMASVNMYGTIIEITEIVRL